jgi:hypothetical protein
LVDEVAIYDQALAPETIRAHYRQIAEARPQLSVQKSVTLTWPSFPPGFMLRTSNNVQGPYLDYTGKIFQDGSNFVAPVPAGPVETFFELVKP